jgi:hypothetical protein
MELTKAIRFKGMVKWVMDIQGTKDIFGSLEPPSILRAKLTNLNCFTKLEQSCCIQLLVISQNIIYRHPQGKI